MVKDETHGAQRQPDRCGSIKRTTNPFPDWFAAGDIKLKGDSNLLPQIQAADESVPER